MKWSSGDIGVIIIYLFFSEVNVNFTNTGSVFFVISSSLKQSFLQ